MISIFDSDLISAELVADIISVSKATLLKWEKGGRLIPFQNPITNKKEYKTSQLIQFEEVRSMFKSNWDEELRVKPARDFSSVELFAGAGGLALGLEKAGFNTIALNELDEDACKTLQANRPKWNVIEGDVKNVDFSKFIDIDLVSGGFPCQAFSYAGEKLGFEDTRGTLFFEFSRAVKEIRPKIFLGENVRGLLNHDNGKTLSVMKSIISDLGYTLIEPKVLKALFYRVPQKRERLFFVGIRNDLIRFAKFKWPSPYYRILVLKDALKAGELYDTDVPESEGQSYPNRKREILSHVPQGGYWRDLPDNLQREYMQGSYFLSGGKTGMARRLSWDEPSLTLTCSPAQKQTERCHPEETRPLTIREYARIQTFSDEWCFSGSVSSQYKQIGNAVPVNLAYAVARSIVALLNSIDAKVDLEGNFLASSELFQPRQLTLLNT
ncbi:DNA (cytosine-5-)-methyltransferase [Synechococcales cyanobacterium C]|uniref:Cytosine-specific methyltransferase n=2 Tax=Petrachloros TaxID=2918834 RepID=A0A8K2A7U3_9CYAN|nr:DNA (cytosine-5-)-methyltransferase [Petrachloros mirabilis ULC683]